MTYREEIVQLIYNTIANMCPHNDRGVDLTCMRLSHHYSIQLDNYSASIRVKIQKSGELSVRIQHDVQNSLYSKEISFGLENPKLFGFIEIECQKVLDFKPPPGCKLIDVNYIRNDSPPSKWDAYFNAN